MNINQTDHTSHIQIKSSEFISTKLFQVSPKSNTKHKLQHQPKFYKVFQQKMNLFQQFVRQLGDQAQIPIKFENYASELHFNESYSITLQSFRELLQKNIQRFINTKYHKKNWGKQDLIILIWIIEKYSLLVTKTHYQFIQHDWQQISQFLPGKNAEDCMFKWLSLAKNQKSQKHLWTTAQEQLLKQLVLQSNHSKQKKWFQISKKLYLRNQNNKVYRTAKQCRERWSCFLNPEVKKGIWNDAQDILLIKNYLEKGKKWAIISKIINGRTQNAIKNRFNLLLSKKKRSKYTQSYISDQDFLKLYLENLQCAQMLLVNDKLKKQTIQSQQSQIQIDEPMTPNKIQSSNVQMRQQAPVEKLCSISKFQSQDALFKSYPSIKAFETNFQFSNMSSIKQIKQDSVLKLYSFPSMNELLKRKSSVMN